MEDSRSTSTDFAFLQKLGSGSFGTVHKVRRNQDDRIYVIKIVRIAELTYREQEEAINEVRILSQMDSPFVVRYYDSYLESDSLFIVMEFCNKGDLQSLVKKAKDKKLICLKEHVTWNIGLQIILGLYYLHRKKILHRDLKCANVFLKKDDTQPYFSVKIGDLGVAKLLETSTAFAQTIVGTPYYLSPELCADQPYRDKSDVWALGVVLYECCTLSHPFEARNQCALIMKIINAQVAFPANAAASKELIQLILLLLQKDPINRPTIREILCEELIRNMLIEHNFMLPGELLQYPITNKLKLAAASTTPENREDQNNNNNNKAITTKSDVKGEISNNKNNKVKPPNPPSTPPAAPLPVPPRKLAGRNKDDKDSGGISSAGTGVRGDRVRGGAKDRIPSQKALVRYQTRNLSQSGSVTTSDNNTTTNGIRRDSGAIGSGWIDTDIDKNIPNVLESMDDIGQALIAAAIARDVEEEAKAIAKQNSANDVMIPLEILLDEKEQKRRLDEILSVAKSQQLTPQEQLSDAGNYEEDFEDDDDDDEETESEEMKGGRREEESDGADTAEEKVIPSNTFVIVNRCVNDDDDKDHDDDKGTQGTDEEDLSEAGTVRRSPPCNRLLMDSLETASIVSSEVSGPRSARSGTVTPEEGTVRRLSIRNTDKFLGGMEVMSPSKDRVGIMNTPRSMAKLLADAEEVGRKEAVSSSLSDSMTRRRGSKKLDQEYDYGNFSDKNSSSSSDIDHLSSNRFNDTNDTNSLLSDSKRSLRDNNESFNKDWKPVWSMNRGVVGDYKDGGADVEYPLPDNNTLENQEQEDFDDDELLLQYTTKSNETNEKSNSIRGSSINASDGDKAEDSKEGEGMNSELSENPSSFDLAYDEEEDRDGLSGVGYSLSNDNFSVEEKQRQKGMVEGLVDDTRSSVLTILGEELYLQVYQLCKAHAMMSTETEENESHVTLSSDTAASIKVLAKTIQRHLGGSLADACKVVQKVKLLLSYEMKLEKYSYHK